MLIPHAVILTKLRDSRVNRGFFSLLSRYISKWKKRVYVDGVYCEYLTNHSYNHNPFWWSVYNCTFRRYPIFAGLRNRQGNKERAREVLFLRGFMFFSVIGEFRRYGSVRDLQLQQKSEKYQNTPDLLPNFRDLKEKKHAKTLIFENVFAPLP